MATEGRCALLGSTPIPLFNIFLQTLSALANVFQQKCFNSKMQWTQNQHSTNRYKESGCAWILLFCLWLLFVPPLQGLSLAENQPLTTLEYSVPLTSPPRLIFFGHGHLVTYSIFWQKAFYNGTPSKDSNKTTKSKPPRCSALVPS